MNTYYYVYAPSTELIRLPPLKSLMHDSKEAAEACKAMIIDRLENQISAVIANYDEYSYTAQKRESYVQELKDRLEHRRNATIEKYETINTVVLLETGELEMTPLQVSFIKALFPNQDLVKATNHFVNSCLDVFVLPEDVLKTISIVGNHT